MNLTELQPGDCLLYKPHTAFGWAIAVKTWNKVSHVEVYAGDGMSYASRDGQGVNAYYVNQDNLAYVLRPYPGLGFDMSSGRDWFSTVQGQSYDWKGILCFTLAVKQGAPDRMFCSEFATQFYRASRLEPFQVEYLADHVAPFEFLTSRGFYRKFSFV